jgi:alkylated DNA repair dioxygenase AlkB
MASNDIRIVKEFVTVDEEKQIVDFAMQFYHPKQCTRVETQQRQAVRFGTFYPYAGEEHHEIHPVLLDVQKRLVDQDVINKLPESTSINFYPPGAFISSHIDNTTTCGPVIPILGLLADCPFVFRSTCNGLVDTTSSGIQEPHTFPRRALFIMQGEKRYKWTHETWPTDKFRISIVFRTRIEHAKQ